MSPQYIDASSIIPAMPLPERQKVWARVIRFIFSDTLLSVLNHQQTITDQERDRLSCQLEERCGLPPNSIFRISD